MIRKSLVALLLSAFAIGAQAHQVWVERDATGPAKIYVGDVDGDRDEGDDVKKLEATTRVFGTDPKKTVKVVAKHGHLEADAGKGDVRLINDQVWKPWKNKEGQLQAAVFNSRAGRTDTSAALDFELVPVAANSNTFTLLFKGKPLANKNVTIVNPEQWTKGFKTDDAGRIEVPVAGKGRYILLSSHELKGDAEVGGEKVQKLSYTTTLSFVAE